MTELIDTNIIGEVMRRRPDRQVDAWFRTQPQIATSAVCVEELVFGLRRRAAFAKESWLRIMLADVGVVHPITDSAAQWADSHRARMQREGRGVAQADALIGACAWEHALILATRNTKYFEGFGIPLFNPFDHQASC
jgi:predicted nucleic acid-binding protein